MTHELVDWLISKGIKFTTSSTYTHEQNGLIERSVRVLLDRLRATLISAGLPLFLWCYILPAMLELVNCTAVTNRDVTPYQSLFDDLKPTEVHKPDMGKYRVIGTLCEILVPPEKRVKSEKLAPRSKTGKLLAVLGSNLYLIYIPTDRNIIKTPFVRIFEKGTLNSLSEGEPLNSDSGNSPISEGVVLDSSPKRIENTEESAIKSNLPRGITQPPLNPLGSESNTDSIKPPDIVPVERPFIPPREPMFEDMDIDNIDIRMEVDFVNLLLNKTKSEIFSAIKSKIKSSKRKNSLKSVPNIFKEVLRNPNKIE